MTEGSVFVVWPWSKRKERIYRYIRKHFKVIDELDIEWDDFPRGLGFFYGLDHPVDIHPDSHPRAFIVRVEADRRLRQTTKGMAEVNPVMFDAKTKLRKWGGKYRGLNSVHGSDTKEEASHNISFMVKPYESLLELLDSIPGRYVVLRNFGGEPDHGDIDLLVEDIDEVVEALRVVRIDAYRFGNIEDIGLKNKYVAVLPEGTVVLDLRYVGDKYFDEGWQEQVLATRIQQDGMWRPSQVQWYWTLLYHALFHKGTLDVYGPLLETLAPGRSHTRKAMAAWMRQQGYEFTQPDDPLLQLFGVVMGVVVDGKGIAGKKPQPGLAEKWEEACGYKPYPGTLNVKYRGQFRLPRDSILSTIVAKLKGGEIREIPLRFWSATIDEIPCHLTVGGNLPDQVEVLAPVHLRKNLNLETGDEIVIVIDDEKE